MPVATPQIDQAALEQGILGIVRDLLREVGSESAARTLMLDSTLERDLGLGSLERVELLVRCEKRFGVRLPDDVAERADTPADWVRALVEGTPSATRAGGAGFGAHLGGSAAPPRRDRARPRARPFARRRFGRRHQLRQALSHGLA